MNALDWVLLAIGFLGLLRGAWRGAVSQIFGIVGIVTGFLVAAHYHQPLAVELSRSFPKLTGTAIISFISLFLLTWLCIGLVGYAAARILHRGGLGFLDRLLGAGVGFGKACVLAVILISILTFFMTPQNLLLRESSLTPFVEEIAHWAVMAAPDNLRMVFDRKSEELKRYWLGQRRAVAESSEKMKKDKELPDDKK
jgi:membrane protein required for colicin V production